MCELIEAVELPKNSYLENVEVDKNTTEELISEWTSKQSRVTEVPYISRQESENYPSRVAF